MDGLSISRTPLERIGAILHINFYLYKIILTSGSITVSSKKSNFSAFFKANNTSNVHQKVGDIVARRRGAGHREQEQAHKKLALPKNLIYRYT